jgi:glycosyltransferase involved in cell wall biosynthesis
MIKRTNSQGLVLGIDATNIRSGGGITHLTELLKNFEIEKYNIDHLIVWGCEEILCNLPESGRIKKISIGSISSRYLMRVIWQRLFLSRAVRNAGCDVLFVPGGNYIGSFSPVVTMSRNMLPFQTTELSRYFFSWIWLRLLILRQLQSYSFRRASGMIFLTQYASRAVQQIAGKLSGQIAVIAHGLSDRFARLPKPQMPTSRYSFDKPFRLIYVSIIDLYKHQWSVVQAVDLLRKEGYPLALELIGPSYPSALRKLRAAIAASDGQGDWVRYVGNVPHEKLTEYYGAADLGIFASSCENMPNILLETMATGLPVACSNKGPMPEVLGDCGLYFDPENPREIATVLRQYLDSPELRASKAEASYQRAKRYSWEDCARKTFTFLVHVAEKRRV